MLYNFLRTERCMPRFEFLHHVCSLGTFAVVSLMVGSTVDKFGCDSYGNGGADSTTMMPLASSIDYDNFTMGGGGGDGGDDCSDGGGLSEVNKCKVAVAAAVTFVGGAIQVQ